MNGLDNDANDIDDGPFTKLKKKWDELPGVVKFLIVFAVVAVVVLLIIRWLKKHRKDGSKGNSELVGETTDGGGSKESFLAAGSDITVNDYVNSYIASTRGELVNV